MTVSAGADTGGYYGDMVHGILFWSSFFCRDRLRDRLPFYYLFAFLEFSQRIGISFFHQVLNIGFRKFFFIIDFDITVLVAFALQFFFRVSVLFCRVSP